MLAVPDVVVAFVFLGDDGRRYRLIWTLVRTEKRGKKRTPAVAREEKLIQIRIYYILISRMVHLLFKSLPAIVYHRQILISP